MRVGLVPNDVPSCEWYRARGAAETLAEQGELECKRLPNPPRLRYALRRTADPEPVGLIDPPDVDVVCFVRGCFPVRIHDVIRLLQREGIAVCVDIDDDYARLPSQLHSLYKINPSVNPLYNWRHALNAVKLADMVTVSTPALRRYRSDAIVVPNYISRAYVETGRQAKRDGRTVGWTGTVFGHPGDLRQCGAGVAEAIRRTDASFLNVGDGVDIQRDLSLDSEPDVSGIVGFDQFPSNLAQIDVGIAPLVLDSYRVEGKSWLKPLEYMAVGAQYVASRSCEYERLQADLERWCERSGIEGPDVPGALVNNRGREWRRELVRYLDADDQTRALRCRAARAFVEQEKLLEDNAWQFAEAWELAVANRRAQGRKVA